VRAVLAESTAVISPPNPSPLDAGARRATCERLFEVSKGRMGPLVVARLLEGTRAGRVAVMRRVPLALVDTLGSAIERAESIAHPRLSKLLGVVHSDGEAFLASEYVDGVTLEEFRAAAADATQPPDPSIAVRIVRDALEGAAACSNLLTKRGAEPGMRYLFEDSVWIASYGETLLADAGIWNVIEKAFIAGQSPAQSGSRLALTGEPFDVSTEQDDVVVAGTWLCELAVGQTAAGAPSDPRARARALNEALAARGVDGGHALVAIVARALDRRSGVHFEGPAAMAAALSRLPETLIASEQSVMAELVRLLGAKLELRRLRLSMSDRDATGPSEAGAEATQFFRVADFARTESRDTARPLRPESRETVRPAQPELRETVRPLQAESNAAAKPLQVDSPGAEARPQTESEDTALPAQAKSPDAPLPLPTESPGAPPAQAESPDARVALQIASADHAQALLDRSDDGPAERPSENLRRHALPPIPVPPRPAPDIAPSLGFYPPIFLAADTHDGDDATQFYRSAGKGVLPNPEPERLATEASIDGSMAEGPEILPAPAASRTRLWAYVIVFSAGVAVGSLATRLLWHAPVAERTSEAGALKQR
jgi:hypothetical protein